MQQLEREWVTMRECCAYVGGRGGQSIVTSGGVCYGRARSCREGMS